MPQSQLPEELILATKPSTPPPLDSSKSWPHSMSNQNVPTTHISPVEETAISPSTAPPEDPGPTAVIDTQFHDPHFESEPTNARGPDCVAG